MRNRIAAAALPMVALVVLALPALDPEAQLYFRDTGRLYAPVKMHIAARLLKGELPLWYPWSEAGVSLLGQVTPGLLHPLTLLYKLLPFELAFKLNHLLALPLAALGLWLLARRLGASPWAAAAGAVAYGGSGFVVSMASSNLPFGLGAATMPWALWALLGLVERPHPLRLLLAGALLALAALAGDVQAMLLGGLVGTVLAVGLSLAQGAKVAARTAGLCALWGACALALSAPAALPAWKSLNRSERKAGILEGDRARFSLSPRRLPGLLVPLAFDDIGDNPFGKPARSRFAEFFAPKDEPAPFSASIAVGAPAFLLALFAVRRRRGALILAGALVLLLAALGPATPLLAILRAAVPGFGLFRYSEKLVGPLTLLLCAAAAIGADHALRGDKSITRQLFAASGLLGLLLAACGLYAGRRPPSLVSALVALAQNHQAPHATRLAGALGQGLLLAGGLLLALALVAALRLRRPGELAPLLAALTCCACVLLSAPASLPVAPLESVRLQPLFAQDFVERAGPSEGRWRFFTNMASPAPSPRIADERLSRDVASAQALQPQYDAMAGIEGTEPYFSALDLEYTKELTEHPSQQFPLLNVRFVLFSPDDYTPEEARKKGFHPARWGFWVKELPATPRAFLTGGAGEAALEVPRPELQRLDVKAARPATLVVSTHFDPGWSATLDGAAVPLTRYQHAVLSLPVPEGAHHVELRFFPEGLRAGLWTFALAVLALLASAGLWSRAGRWSR